MRLRGGRERGLMRVWRGGFHVERVGDATATAGWSRTLRRVLLAMLRVE